MMPRMPMMMRDLIAAEEDATFLTFVDGTTDVSVSFDEGNTYTVAFWI